VRIRSRKPCVRARRRLFGWKVRLPLLTVDSPGRRHGTGPAVGLMKCALDATCWSAMVLGGTRAARNRRRTPFPPGYAAPRERVKPPRYSLSAALQHRRGHRRNAERVERHPAGHPSASCVRARLVSDGRCRLACPPQRDEAGNPAQDFGTRVRPGVRPRPLPPDSRVRSGGIPQPARQQPGPATRRRARPRTVFTHRCGQVWGWLPPRPGRRHASVAGVRREAEGGATWPISPASWRTCGAG